MYRVRGLGRTRCKLIGKALGPTDDLAGDRVMTLCIGSLRDGWIGDRAMGL